MKKETKFEKGAKLCEYRTWEFDYGPPEVPGESPTSEVWWECHNDEHLTRKANKMYKQVEIPRCCAEDCPIRPAILLRASSSPSSICPRPRRELSPGSMQNGGAQSSEAPT